MTLTTHQSALLFSGGIYIENVGAEDDSSHTELPHHDDYYVVEVLYEGDVCLEIDFRQYNISSGQAVIVCPGQMHRFINEKKALGFNLMIDASLMDKHYSNLLRQYSAFNQHVIPLDVAVMKSVMALAGTLSDNTFSDVEIYQHLALAILGIVAGNIQSEKSTNNERTRKQELAMTMRTLMDDAQPLQMSPSYYADRMHISTAYLNEVVSDVLHMNSSQCFR